MRKLLKHWPLTLAAMLALCCGLCIWRLWAVSNLLESQKAAQSWKGTGERSSPVPCGCLLALAGKAYLQLRPKWMATLAPNS